MNLKILILTNGDKIVGSCVSETNEVITYVDVLKLVKPDESRIIDIAPLLIPWDTSCLDAKVDIYTQNVVASMEPTDEIKGYYKKYLRRYKFAVAEPERFNKITEEVIETLKSDGREEVTMGEFSELFDMRMLEAVESYHGRKLN